MNEFEQGFREELEKIALSVYGKDIEKSFKEMTPKQKGLYGGAAAGAMIAGMGFLPAMKAGEGIMAAATGKKGIAKVPRYVAGAVLPLVALHAPVITGIHAGHAIGKAVEEKQKKVKIAAAMGMGSIPKPKGLEQLSGSTASAGTKGFASALRSPLSLVTAMKPPKQEFFKGM
jgi:hypothetical protein